MAAPVLDKGQREYLLELIAAQYDTPTIKYHFLRVHGIALTRENIHSYRKRHGVRISEIQSRRRDEALERGVANQAERIARLIEHADELDRIKWVPDDNGRLWNEKAWRECLQQVAKEKGELVERHDHRGSIEVIAVDYR